MLNKFENYYNTIQYLKPVQLLGQLTKHKKIRRVYCGKINIEKVNWALRTVIPELDENPEYLKRFDVEEICKNKITLLHETHELNTNTWYIEASPLWRFNLHYFEYGIALAVAYKNTLDERYYRKFKEFVISWIKINKEPKGDAWHPYTISMRLPNWHIAMDIFGAKFKEDLKFKELMAESVYIQYRTLLLRQETWQLGNHYYENLKTILFGSLLFKEEDIYLTQWKKLQREIKEEILSDGFHFELSPMYHKVILEDTLRIANWLKQCGKENEFQEILKYIIQMSNALVTFDDGKGRTPLFNDSGNNITKPTIALLEVVKSRYNIEPVDTGFLYKCGYYKIRKDNMVLLFDSGKVGPDYMPGHGHCDCLSFELIICDTPLFVNSGTFQYQGDLRSFFRSTAAHNTVMIDDREQSEMWGEHRVARRIHNIKAKSESMMVVGKFTSYFGDRFIRKIMIDERNITIFDSIKASDDYKHIARRFLHLSPETQYQINEKNVNIIKNGQKIAEIVIPGSNEIVIHTDGILTNYAEDFGKLEHKEVLEIKTNFQKNIELLIKIELS